MDVNNSVTVVVRSVGERTEQKCVEYLEKIFGKENVFLVKNEIPFSKAVKKTFEIGIKRNKKWTLAIDSDAFLFEDKIKKFINNAEKFTARTPNLYCLEGKLFDKFSQVYREVGCHLYSTKTLKKALKFVDDGTNSLRPETHVKLEMANSGYGFYVTNMRIGIHDFFQSSSHIVKKALLHCRKHSDIGEWIQKWQDLAKEDSDFVWALKGKEISDSIQDKTILVDSNYMDDLLSQHPTEFPIIDKLGDEEILKTLEKYDVASDNYESFALCFNVRPKSPFFNKIFSKEKQCNKRILTILGIKISYKKKDKNGLKN